MGGGGGGGGGRGGPGGGGPAAPSASKSEAAGTGMGRQQQNLVTSVEFSENAGMYAVKDVLKIFYEFAQDPEEPLPFVDDDEDEGRFTPEMTR